MSRSCHVTFNVSLIRCDRLLTAIIETINAKIRFSFITSFRINLFPKFFFKMKGRNETYLKVSKYFFLQNDEFWGTLIP